MAGTVRGPFGGSQLPGVDYSQTRRLSKSDSDLSGIGHRRFSSDSQESHPLGVNQDHQFKTAEQIRSDAKKARASSEVDDTIQIMTPEEVETASLVEDLNDKLNDFEKQQKLIKKNKWNKKDPDLGEQLDLLNDVLAQRKKILEYIASQKGDKWGKREDVNKNLQPFKEALQLFDKRMVEIEPLTMHTSKLNKKLKNILAARDNAKFGPKYGDDKLIEGGIKGHFAMALNSKQFVQKYVQLLKKEEPYVRNAILSQMQKHRPDQFVKVAENVYKSLNSQLKLTKEDQVNMKNIQLLDSGQLNKESIKKKLILGIEYQLRMKEVAAQKQLNLEKSKLDALNIYPYPMDINEQVNETRAKENIQKASKILEQETANLKRFLRDLI